MHSIIILPFLLAFVSSWVSSAYRTKKEFSSRKSWASATGWSFLQRTTALRKSKTSFSLPSSSETRRVPFAEEMQRHKDMYYKLQNLERHPNVLPEARKILISFFSEVLAIAHEDPSNGILSMETFEPQRLAKFLQSEDESITQRWEQYIARRKAGSPREMFRDLEHAKWWLEQSSPVKFVDGAWLGHIHRVTTPFSLRHITKTAWQVMSEELGDGDLAKNHAHIWHNLIKETGCELPAGDSADFANSQNLNVPHVWKAALAQLLISLFPHDFLPEILGFNMQYEMLTWDTMRAVKELKELKLNNYYFLLHISIDNADSGHTAMAMQAVVDYMKHVEESEGKTAVQQAWRRVQAGFLLSKCFSTSPEPQRHHDELEDEVTKVFKAKASVAHKLHCGCNMKIGRRSLVDWLEPTAFGSKEWQQEFLEALSSARPWIYKGDSGKSKLVQELLWKGKMFGSFTETEVDVLRRWIDSLAATTYDSKVYWSFIDRDDVSGMSQQAPDICTDYPVFSPAPKPSGPPSSPTTSLPLSALSDPVKISRSPNLDRLLPLWFAHASLLESFPAVPFKTTTATASAIIRVLRAQYGFTPEGPGVAGMDEVRRSGNTDIIALGQKMMRKARMAEPACLKEVLDGRDPSGFAVQMLHFSMRPVENKEMLLGIAWAFVGLHDAIGAPESGDLLSEEDKGVLKEMGVRERLGLQVCLDELRADEARYVRFCRGFEMGKGEIERCYVD